MTTEISPCANELQKVIGCTKSNEGACSSCLPSSRVKTSLTQTLESQFRTTSAYLNPTEKGYCAEANARVCLYHEQDLKCCCESETMDFIKCAFNNIYTTKYGVVEECSQSCIRNQGIEKSEVGGLSTVMIVVLSGILLVAVAFCACIYLTRKKPQTMDKESNETQRSPNDDSAFAEMPLRVLEGSWEGDPDMNLAVTNFLLAEREAELLREAEMLFFEQNLTSDGLDSLQGVPMELSSTDLLLAEHEAEIIYVEQNLISEELDHLQKARKKTKAKLKKANRIKKKVKAALAKEEAEQREMLAAIKELIDERDELAYRVARLLEPRPDEFHDEPNGRMNNFMTAYNLPETPSAFNAVSEVSSETKNACDAASEVLFSTFPLTSGDKLMANDEIPSSQPNNKVPETGMHRSLSTGAII